MPEFIAPQLATLVKEPPNGDEWFHELKFDGYRMICHIDHGKARFWSRNGKDWTDKFLNLAQTLKTFPATTAILDGEVVVVDAAGRSSFQRLQQSMGRGGKAPAFVFEVFDLIYLEGRSENASWCSNSCWLQRSPKGRCVTAITLKETA